MDLLEGHDGVAGDEDGVVFHPAARFGVEPGSVFALTVDHLGGELRTPVNFKAALGLKLGDIGGDEAFGHDVIVVVEPLAAEAGVFLESVVCRDPAGDGFDAGVRGIEVSVDEGEEAGVGHGAVTTEGDTAGLAVDGFSGF